MDPPEIIIGRIWDIKTENQLTALKIIGFLNRITKTEL